MTISRSFAMLIASSVLVLIVSSCGSISHVDRTISTPSFFNSNLIEFSEKTIFVRGYLILASEGHMLYESKAKFEDFGAKWDGGDENFDPNDYKTYCLTIANPVFLQDYVDQVSYKTVVMKGQFIKDYPSGKSVDLGACSIGTAIFVDEADFKSLYPSIFR